MCSLLLAASLGLLLQNPAVPPTGGGACAAGSALGGKGVVCGDHTIALPLSPADEHALREALAKKNYQVAEAMLLQGLAASRGECQRWSVLLELGGIYFLDHDPAQAAIAWNKAAVIKRPPASIRFSLAMAYIQMGHEEWAERVLAELREEEPTKPDYPFWLGRIAYDRQRYDTAIVHFREALAIDPTFARAHDNLGLSLFYINQVDAAIAQFKSAIALEAGRQSRSAWPYLNLGIAYDFRGESAEAVSAFTEAIKADPEFAEAHYRLGNVLLKLNRIDEAATEENTAATLKGSFAEPHLVLSRLYRRMGRDAESKVEEEKYKQLHAKGETPVTLPKDL